MNAGSTSNILKRSLWTSLIAVVSLGIALWFGGRMWLSNSLMPYEGVVTLDGLDARAEVLFDQRGIPRVYAGSDADAMRALGWLHAGERLFQMELIRRLSRGELAELVGEAALGIDVLHRSFGFARRIESDPPELEPQTRQLIEAYVAGINARLDESRLLPPEFVILRNEPDPWRVEDVLTIAYYQTFYPNTLVQRMRDTWHEMTEKLGDEAGRWLASLPDWTEATIPAQRMTEASNTWVVAPERSHSGAALHASDPHLDYDIAPGLWYAVGLHSDEGLDVLGVTVPGLPFVVMGHNGDIAWAFTVAPVDVFEIYRQARHPEDRDRVRGPEGWEPITSRTETFRLRGREEPVERRLKYSPRGRIIEDAGEDGILTLHWAGFDLDTGELIENGLAINRAGNFDDFRHAASDLGALSVNWSYSDRQGNIGYVQSTPVPRRNHERFFRVLDAADPANQWDGYHPPEERPFAFNPEQGWLANSNNHAAGEDWPYPIPGYYKHLRMRRATALLESQQRFDRDDMVAFQLDRVSDRALSWKEWLADIAERSGRTQIAGELRGWDGTMAADSETAGLFARWWEFLPRALFDDEDRSPDWYAMRAVLDNWLHSPSETAPMSWIERDRAALRALEDALQAGARPLGNIQPLTISHAMAGNAVLDRWLHLSRGPFPIGGDAGSLNVTYVSFNPETAIRHPQAGASMRYVMDWSDRDAFTLNLTLGQSGNPFSPHFDDFLDEFLAGEPWPAPWSRDAVEQRTASRLVLTPDA